MTYPSSTNPDAWAQAFASWLQEDGTTFDHDSMADWFEAAFKAAAGQPTTIEQPKAASNIQTVGDTDGVWISYHYDRSGVYPFGDELTALRHAVSNSCDAKFVPFGAEVLDP